MSDTAFFVCSTIFMIAAIGMIIKMVWNRSNGKDELDGVFDFKRKKKGRE